jgi:hypothetical protein
MAYTWELINSKLLYELHKTVYCRTTGHGERSEECSKGTSSTKCLLISASLIQFEKILGVPKFAEQLNETSQLMLEKTEKNN